MYRPTVLVSAPVATRSGYGARSRDVVRSLLELDKFDITINALPWGNTAQNALSADDPKDKGIIECIKPWEEGTPDVHIHIVIPNEFQPIGKYNIGITAGLEATIVPSSWLEGINRMNLVLCSSNFGAHVMRNSGWKNNDTGESLTATTPILTFFEGADTDIYHKTNECSVTLKEEMDKIKEKWNFLFVGHWLQGGLGQDRKDVGNLVKTFMSTFKKSQGAGLILKTSGANVSRLDKEDMLRRLDDIRISVINDDMPNVYLLHGDLHDTEMNDLYNHPKVKAHITFTHGEGYGRPLLEASLSGKPIIAPNWSGHVDFLNPKHTRLLEGGLISVPQGGFQEGIWVEEQQWFQVDVQKAAFAMKEVKRLYNQYKKLGGKLSRTNRNKSSLKKMTELLGNILGQNLPKFTETVGVKLPKLNVPKLEKV
jgi:glycosyltransferase involved in cell wall biosynthesis